MSLRKATVSLFLLALTARGELPTDKVVERYQQMLEKNPAEGTALERLWKIHVEAGSTAELLDQYKAGGSFSSEMVLGLLLQKAGTIEEAVAAFERAAGLDEKSPLPLLALARVNTELRLPKVAAEWLEKAVAILPEGDARLVETLFQLGSAWLAAGEAVKAAEAWERTVVLSPADLALRRRLAETYVQNHLPQPAIAHLEYIAANAPATDRAQALEQLARVQQGAGNQDAAIRALEQALALTAPGNWLRTELQSQLIRLHQRYHRTPELEDRWRQFAAENPRDTGAHLQLIDLYERLGDLDQQREWLERLVALAPKDAVHRLRLARLFLHLDRLDDAVLAFDALLAAQPTNADFVIERSRLDVQRDDLPAARRRIAALLAAKKNDEVVRANALTFYEQNRLHDLTEAHLTEDAEGGEEKAVAALANFLFAQRREPDARRTLARLVKPDATPAAQAAAQSRIAQTLKGHGDLPGALAAAEIAARLAPDVREFHMLLGELRAAGEPAAAQASFERALALSGTPAEEIEADQKLFESLRPPARLGAASGGIDADPQSLGVAARGYLEGLKKRAFEQPTESAWLRIARWQSWAHDQRAALDAAQKALALNPKSIAAQEFIVKVHAASGAGPLAVAGLGTLMEIDPANRAAYQRRAGQTEMQSGRTREALTIFETLAKENPGSLDALTDLALAQQRAERWSDALATWNQAHALSPASKKKDTFQPLLRVLEKLELHQQAADLILRATDAETDARAQGALFADLLAHCAKRGLLDWLRIEFEQRRKLRADDYFTEMALGRILKAGGNKAAAFEVLADASYAAPNQAESLPELVREAEELRKLGAAVQLQAQLVRVAAQDRPEALLKLAQLQERNFAIEDAAKTWERIAAKFPRDTEALGSAVEFQLKWGTNARAAELLRKLRALDPSNLKTLAKLASLDAELGETTEVERCLEELLDLAPMEKAGDAVRIPAFKAEDASRIQAAYRSVIRQRGGSTNAATLGALRAFWQDTPDDAKNDRELRLHAIRQLAQMVQARGDAEEIEGWVARWVAAPDVPTETLWALHYCGASAATLDHVETMLAREPANPQTKQAFIWLALQSREYARLSAWMQDRRRTPAQRDYLMVALGQHVQVSGGRLDPAMIGSLFPDGARSRLWQAASVFAARGHLREAAQLGQRVFDGVTTQRAAYGLELAHWQLQLGETEKAREILRGAIETTAESFDAPLYAALREYWLLLPVRERASFTARYLASADPYPLHRAISGTLLHGLAGQDAEARANVLRVAELEALAPLALDDTGTAGSRRWVFLLTGGRQLQAWGLEALTVHLWSRALRDEALISLEGEMAVDAARDMRRRLAALRIARAGSESDAQEALDSYARSAPRDGLLQLAEALDQLGATGRAIAVYRQLWEQMPGDPQALRNLVAACRNAQDNETAEEALAKTIREGNIRGNNAILRDLILQLAGFYERSGRIGWARALIEDAATRATPDSRLTLALAAIHQRSGDIDPAIAAYGSVLAFEPRNATALNALAGLHETRGDFAEALRVLRKGTGHEVEARVALLHAKSGHTEEALAALDRIAAPQNVWPTINVATALSEKGERQLARVALQTALDRNAEPRMRFPLQSKVVELLAPADSEAAIGREFRRLRQLAGEQPELLSSYFDLARKESARLGVVPQFERELAALWADGAGPVAAGLSLLAGRVEAQDAGGMKTALDRLLARDDLGEVWLTRLADLLQNAKRADLAARVREQLVRVNPASEPHAIELARALDLAGRPAEARAVLVRLEARAVLDPGLAGRLASAYAGLGDVPRATALYSQALRADPQARIFRTWLDFAQMQIAARDFAGAKKTLRTAFGNPANAEFGTIVGWLVESGRLGKMDAELEDFGLSPRRRTMLRRALFSHYEQGGQLAAAAAIVDEHPDTIEPGMAARLRTMARVDRNFDLVATLLEKLVAQSPEPPDMPVELARLYVDWAQHELATEGADAAIEHMVKAHALRPALFEVASGLATVQAQRGEREAAIETLQLFIGTSKIAGETAKAREFLAKLNAVQ